MGEFRVQLTGLSILCPLIFCDSHFQSFAVSKSLDLYFNSLIIKLASTPDTTPYFSTSLSCNSYCMNICLLLPLFLFFHSPHVCFFSNLKSVIQFFRPLLSSLSRLYPEFQEISLALCRPVASSGHLAKGSGLLHTMLSWFLFFSFFPCFILFVYYNCLRVLLS